MLTENDKTIANTVLSCMKLDIESGYAASEEMFTAIVPLKYDDEKFKEGIEMLFNFMKDNGYTCFRDNFQKRYWGKGIEYNIFWFKAGNEMRLLFSELNFQHTIRESQEGKMFKGFMIEQCFYYNEKIHIIPLFSENYRFCYKYIMNDEMYDSDGLIKKLYPFHDELTFKNYPPGLIESIKMDFGLIPETKDEKIKKSMSNLR